MNDLMGQIKRRTRESKEYIENIFGEIPPFAVIFGTGLSNYTIDNLTNKKEITYSEVPFMNNPLVEYHSGKIIKGTISNNEVLCLCGRNHYYEGHDIQKIVYPIHLLKELGIENLLITSSVGGISEKLEQGDLMLVNDHINLTSTNPLIGYDNSLGERFLRCSDVYNKELVEMTKKSAKNQGIFLKEGVMFFLPGPTFETPSEFIAMKKLGADTIGWSTVPEAIVAHYRGIKTFGINCITDSLNYKSVQSLEEINITANKSSKNLYNILKDILK